VTVLTSTFWPISMSTSSCPPPPELARACKSFEQFYFSRHSGRRLTWQLSLGNADIRVAFKAKTHDLNVSTYALIILLLFERLSEDEFLTYEARSLKFGLCTHHKPLLQTRKSKMQLPLSTMNYNGIFNRSRAPGSRY
jgi:hypothetical protein